MLKKIFYGSIFFILLIVFSKLFENNFQILNSNKKFKITKEYEYEGYSAFGIILWKQKKCVNLYNKEGKILEQYFLEDSKKIKYQYDQNGNLCKLSKLSKNILVEYDTFSFNNSNKLLLNKSYVQHHENKYYLQSINSIEYYNNDSIKKEINSQYSIDNANIYTSKCEYFYDSTKNTTKKIFIINGEKKIGYDYYDNNKRLIKTFDHFIGDTIIYKYSANKVIEVSKLKEKNKIVQEKMLYDKSGNLIKHLIFQGEKIYTYTFKYDKYNRKTISYLPSFLFFIKPVTINEYI